MGLWNAISQAQHLQRTAGEHILAGTPQASATKALLRLGNALVGGDVDGTYLAIGAPSGFPGELVNLQVNGVTAFKVDSTSRVTIGSNALNGRHVEIGADGSSGLIRCHEANSANSNGALARITLSCNGGGNTNSGDLAAFTPNHSSSILQDRFGLQSGSDSTGLIFNANGASQDMIFAVQGTRAITILSGRQVNIGTSTANLARLSIVGVGDEVQFLVQGNSIQNQDFARFQTSGGTQILQLTNAALFRLRNTSNSVRVEHDTANGYHALNGAVISTVALTLNTLNAGNLGLLIKMANGQTQVPFRTDDFNAGGTLLTVNASGELTLNRQSSTTFGRQVAFVAGDFAVSTDATRQGRIRLHATDWNGDREIMRGEADGTNPKVGFLGAAAVVRQAVAAAATDQATVITLANSIRTALINLGLAA